MINHPEHVLSNTWWPPDGWHLRTVAVYDLINHDQPLLPVSTSINPPEMFQAHWFEGRNAIPWGSVLKILGHSRLSRPHSPIPQHKNAASFAISDRRSRLLGVEPWCTGIWSSKSWSLDPKSASCGGVISKEFPSTLQLPVAWALVGFSEVSQPSMVLKCVKYTDSQSMTLNAICHTNLAIHEKIDAAHFFHRLQRLCESLGVA